MSGEARTPPYSKEAEIGLLGCLMIDPLRTAAVMRAQYRLSPDSFYIPQHRTIAGVALAMIDEQKRMDLLTLAQKLRDLDALDAIGGDAYLQNIMDLTPSVEGAVGYALIVQQKAISRQVIEEARRLVEDAYSAPEPDALLKEAPERFLKIVSGVHTEPNAGDLIDRSISTWIEARTHKKPAIDLHMPWEPLTMLMQGLEVGVTIVAGRPSHGKTTLEGIIAAHQCKQGFPVARATADSTVGQLLDRQVCGEAGVSLAKLKMGFANNSQITQCQEAGKSIRGWPQWINDRDTEIAAICTWARFMKARHNIRLFTVDYIQQLRASHLKGYAANDPVTRVTTISSMLKALSFELGIPVVVLSQLNREVEKENRHPRLSDLRDSGGIEQDASKVLFCFVDQKKAKAMDDADPHHEATKHKRPLWISVLKNKDGETGDLPFWMYPPYFLMAPAIGKMRQFKNNKGEIEDRWDPFWDDALPGEEKHEDKAAEPAPNLIPDDFGRAEPDEPDPRYT